jgi:hypothetical protein
MNNQNCHYANSEKDVTGTNLLLAQLLLKTTDDKTRLIDNPALLTIIQSLCKTSELYFSRPTPLQCLPDDNVHSRAISDSTSTCNSSLSLPSSVHVSDVTHDQCVAHEHHASHGVSGTANETNVNPNSILDDTEGMSNDSKSSSISRKRPANLTDDGIPPPFHICKRSTPESREKPMMCSEPMTSVFALKEYLKITNKVQKGVMDAHKRIHSAGKYEYLIIIFQYLSIPSNITSNLHHSRSFPIYDGSH